MKIAILNECFLSQGHLNRLKALGEVVVFENTETEQAPTTTAEKVEYTCPMHPEVITNEPGDCPKCGMTLEKKEPAKKEEMKMDGADSTMKM